MRLIALFLFLLLPPSYSGQVFSSLEAVENKNTTLISNAAESDEKIIETVTASGYGTSVDAAAQNAAENALTQVVGSFIDAETQIKKQKEIRDGVISKTKVIKKDIRDYSQGSIQYFEVLNVQQNGSIYNVTARVDVRVEDFRAYIKELAYGSQKMSKGLFREIATNVDSSNKKLDLTLNKIIKPILEGEVIKITLGDPISHSDYCAIRTGLGICTANQLNHQKTVFIPVNFNLKEEFIDNITNILDNISDNKKSDSTYSPFWSVTPYQRAKIFPEFNTNNDFLISLKNKNSTKSNSYYLKNILRQAKEELNPDDRYAYTKNPITASGLQLANLSSNIRINLLDSYNNALLSQTLNPFYKEYSPKRGVKNNLVHLYLLDETSVASQYSLLLKPDTSAYMSDIHFQRQYLLALDLQVETLNKIEKVEIEYIK
tara:strand:- start:48 stop:1340 length:1293 start_codon:yes stop_codon:yes gene_type:complete